LQRPDTAQDALALKDHASMEVVPFGDSGRGGGDACNSSTTTRVSIPTTPTTTLDSTGQQQFLDFLSWKKEFLKEFKHDSVRGTGKMFKDITNCSIVNMVV
jgi:hypothetical protein